MSNLRERLEIEVENLRQVVSQMPVTQSLRKLSPLELAGVAALMHSFYNGIENALKQVLIDQKVTLPQSPTWHRDLLNLSNQHEVVAPETIELLREYLAFRHFFSHAYAHHVDPEKILPLVERASETLNMVCRDLGMERGSDAS